MATDPRDITERLRIKSAMINLGEKIAWGSETALMDEAADTIAALREKLEAAEAACVEWSEVSQRNYQRAKKSEQDNADLQAKVREEQRRRFEAEAALTTARAEGAANWLAGRDAAAERVSLLGRVVSMDSPTGRATERCLSVVRSTPLPADFAAALAEHDQRVWNAAAKLVEEAPGSITDRQELASRIRALAEQGGEA